MEEVSVVKHPLIQHKLTLVRDKSRTTESFRRLLNEIGMLLCYEVMRDLPLTQVEIDTPLATMMSPRIAGKTPIFAPILRSGLTFVEGMLDLVPEAGVAHIDVYRNPQTFAAVEYYFKAPSDLCDRLTIVAEPILATGNTAVAAVERLKEHGAKQVRFVSLICARQGLDQLCRVHPDVKVWTAAIDSELNEHAYIVPGLGDAGDRAFGTT